jgi:hypothetical protein
MKRLLFSLAVILVLAFLREPVYAYDLPKDNSQAGYFCVFGPNSSRYDGADVDD